MRYNNGLSAVELLVALLIAGVFIISGYQLYTYVFKNGTQASQRAEASNLAYAKMREKAASVVTAGGACATSTATSTPSGTTLPSPSITVAVSCPYGTTGSLSNVFRVTSTINYTDGSGAQSVSHAILVKT